MATRPASRGSLRRRARAILDQWVELFDSHDLLTNASAIGLRVLVSLIPLTLLGVALLGAFGLEHVWHDDVAPTLKAHFTPPVYHALDSSAKAIFSHDTIGLVLFAAALTIWNVSSAVRACMGGLDAIYEQDDERSVWHRFGLSLGLGATIAVCVVGAILALVAAPTLTQGDTLLDGLLSLARWAIAVGLLSLGIALLVHFGPAHRRAEKWVGAGTVLVVATWILASLAFRWFVGSVVDFKSAAGSLAAFLVLTTYVYVSSIIFLVGVQLDELLRKGRATG